jgi:hypothetical protein
LWLGAAGGYHRNKDSKSPVSCTTLKTAGLLLFFALARAQATPIVLVSTTGNQIGTVDLATGLFTQLGVTPVAFTDIAISPDGIVYGVGANTNPNSLYQYNLHTGTSTLVGSTGQFINGLTYSSGVLYGSGDTHIYTLNPNTGAATRLGTGSFPNGYASSGDLDFTAAGTLYATADRTGRTTDYLMLVNLLTGAVTRVGTGNSSLGYDNAYGLVYEDGVMYMITAAGGIYTVNLSTGRATFVRSITGFSGEIWGATNGPPPEPPEPLPEPTSATLAILGAALLAFRARRH